MLEQHFELQTMLHRWNLGCPWTSKNEKCSRPDHQMDDTDDSDSWFHHPWSYDISNINHFVSI